MTQTECVLNHLNTYGELHNITAIHEYKILRLAAIVHNLRQLGHNIITEETGKSGVALYKLR
jgi:hypothetical protein